VKGALLATIRRAIVGPPRLESTITRASIGASRRLWPARPRLGRDDHVTKRSLPSVWGVVSALRSADLVATVTRGGPYDSCNVLACLHVRGGLFELALRIRRADRRRVACACRKLSSFSLAHAAGGKIMQPGPLHISDPDAKLRATFLLSRS
jgi:hypothetical protein